MQISREDCVRMERAHVLAWPALHMANIDGWLWRSSGGNSQRANSVSTIDFHGADLQAAITAVEFRYSALGLPARFQTFDETTPCELPDLLRARGYAQSDPTITMFKRIKGTAMTPGVEIRDHPWPEWCQIYLGEITENRREVNQLILERIPAPRAFFGYCRDGELVATALGIVGFGCVVIECVTTRSDARRQGAAQLALSALETWAAQQTAEWIGLQVVATNTPALRLYERLGFIAGATNRFWVSPAVAVRSIG